MATDATHKPALEATEGDAMVIPRYDTWRLASPPDHREPTPRMAPFDGAEPAFDFTPRNRDTCSECGDEECGLCRECDAEECICTCAGAGLSLARLIHMLEHGVNAPVPPEVTERAKGVFK